jgi:hypothetical protein
MFFRSEGGSSSTFGEVQTESSNRLSGVMYPHRLGWETPYPWDVSIPAAGLSDFVLAGYYNDWFPDYGQRYWVEGIRFMNSGGMKLDQ